MVLPPLCLEPPWNRVTAGDKISFLADIVIWDPAQRRHLLRSAGKRVLVLVEGFLPKAEAYSLLDVQILSTTKGFRVECEQGHVLPHQVPEMSCAYLATEVCAGIGCLGRGLETAGMKIQASNELRETFVRFQSLQGRTVLQGDIGDVGTIAKLHAMQQGPGCLAGGFSCQPWSHLGDKGAGSDQRAATLVYMLRAAYFTRAHSIIMECVVGAGKDPEVNRTISEFCAWTGYRKVDVELSLQHILPARRDRWWCVLSSPAWPAINLRPLPMLNPLPSIQELLPYCPQWDNKDQQQIQLDRYETTKHEMYGGLHNKLVSSNGQLPTALHGWGNQLYPCPCGCRSSPMAEHRLAEKGIFAALVLMEGSYETAYQGTLPQTRHLHPWELAVLHGMPPSMDFSQGLRLGIAGLGQMASPIQSNWVAGHLLGQIEARYDLPCQLPEVRLGNHFRTFFAAVAQDQPALVQQPAFEGYVQRLWGTLTASIAANQVQWPLQASDVSIAANHELCDEEKTKIERTGRKDLKSDNNQPPDRTEAPAVEHEKKQPALEPQELPKEDEVPAHGTYPELHTAPSVAHDHTRRCIEEPFAQDHPMNPGHVREGFHPAFAHRHPGQSSVDPTSHDQLRNLGVSRTVSRPFVHDHHHQIRQDIMPGSTAPEIKPITEEGDGHRKGNMEPKTTPADHQGLASHQWTPGSPLVECVNPRILPTRAPLPRVQPGGSSQQQVLAPNQSVFSVQGGLQAFARNRSEQVKEYPRNVCADTDHGLSTQQVEVMFSQPEVQQTQVDTAPSMSPESPHDPPVTTHLELPDANQLSIQLIRPDETKPTEVKISEHATVGNIIQAELQCCASDQPLRITNMLGKFLDPTTRLHADQQLFINMHEAGHSHRGVTHLHPEAPPFARNHAPVERIGLLYQQGPWVEVGEYQYYLQ